MCTRRPILVVHQGGCRAGGRDKFHGDVCVPVDAVFDARKLSVRELHLIRIGLEFSDLYCVAAGDNVVLAKERGYGALCLASRCEYLTGDIPAVPVEGVTSGKTRNAIQDLEWRVSPVDGNVHTFRLGNWITDGQRIIFIRVVSGFLGAGDAPRTGGWRRTVDVCPCSIGCI